MGDDATTWVCTYDGCDCPDAARQLRAERDRLRAENAGLRAVVDAARAYRDAIERERAALNACSDDPAHDRDDDRDETPCQRHGCGEAMDAAYDATAAFERALAALAGDAGGAR